MPYCAASSVIVNSSVSYSRTNARRCSMGDISRHGIEAPPAGQAPRPCGENVTHVAGLKCYLCRWTEPNVGRARQRVFRVLTGLDVEARHTVGQHGPCPRLPVAVGHDVVRRAPWCGHLPLGHAFCLGIEHTDRVALVFGKPQPAFVIDATTPRAGVGCRSLVYGRLLGLCIDLDEVARRKIEQIGVVLRVRVDPVRPNALAGLRIFEGAEILHLVGAEIEPIYVADVGVLDPHLVVTIGTFDCEMPELAAVRIPLLWG